MRRRAVAASGLALTALLLAGCADPVPTPDPAPAPVVAPPVLDTDQETRVLDAVGQALEAGLTDATAMDERVVGPARTIRASQLAVAAATGAAPEDAVTALPTELETSMVTTSTQWPRSVFAVSVQPDLQTQRLFALRQDSARDNYQLWGWVRLFPELELPAFTSPDAGSIEVAADDAELALTPVDAIGHYADALSNGAESAYANDFPTDPFRERIAKISADLNEALAPAEGRQTMTFSPVPDSLMTMATGDGGAIVIGEMTAVEDRTAEEGATISPATETERALLGESAVTNAMTIGYSTVVAIYLPPVGSDEQPRALGVEHVATSVSVPG
ncbi:MAG: hypothetical protein ACTMIR_00895 [Cellulomonadaceae bacterium]